MSKIFYCLSLDPLLDFCSIPYIAYTLYASFSDRSRVKSLGLQTICKECNLPPRLDAGCGLRFKSARAYHFVPEINGL